jgi:hypothetical protein
MENGSFVNNMNDIGLYFFEYFQNLFTSSNPSFDDELDSLFSLVISNAENNSICNIPDESEIRKAISQLGLTKALGPNGFTGLFFKTYWKTIRISVILFVQSFFRNGVLLKKFNHTHLALILKIDNPLKVTQFRPISLNNLLMSYSIL